MERLTIVLVILMSSAWKVSAVACPAYPSVANGVVTYNPLSPIPQLTYDPGTIATLSCNLGFMLTGPMTTKCGPNGSWEPNLGSCSSLAGAASANTAGSDDTCGPVNHEMGTITYIPGVQPPKFQAGALAVLSCPPGQAVVGGASQAICQNGKWSATLGSCKQTNLKLF